jgi:hypothetical protein
MARAFAGPLCRWFAGDGDPAAFLDGVLRWRQDLAQALGLRLRVPLDWREDPHDDGRWCDLGDAGWTALRLFAFYADRSDLELPDTVPARPELDREFRSALDAKFERSRYGQLLACTLWLPVEMEFTCRVPLPDGETAEVGSLPVLGDQLRWLQQRTWQAGDAEVERWADLPAERGGALLGAAQRGFAGLWRAATVARRRGVPLLVEPGPAV